ncbi:hypothetical protein N7497_005234 [Penicillium chrysogenum]|nr:hypothetical protein N7497_005234 [Penicillium chrysogenum]
MATPNSVLANTFVTALQQVGYTISASALATAPPPPYTATLYTAPLYTAPLYTAPLYTAPPSTAPPSTPFSGLRGTVSSTRLTYQR